MKTAKGTQDLIWKILFNTEREKTTGASQQTLHYFREYLQTPWVYNDAVTLAGGLQEV